MEGTKQEKKIAETLVEFEVMKKFNLLTEHALDSKKRDRIAEEVNRLEKMEHVATLADLLR